MSANPYLNLLSTAWKYAQGDKKKYLQVYGLFCLTNVVDASRPILYGWMINGIQEHGLEVWRYAWQYALVYLGLAFLEWSMHAPARVIERSLAFNLSRNFMMELYHQALHLPVKWHQDHHSGIIISRIRKAYEALKEFFQNGFMYIHALAKFLMSFAAMLYFSPLFGGIGLILGALTVYIIFRFDRPLIKNLHETNEREHKVSANLFDSLSNINTVITLRLEKQMHGSLLDTIQHVWPPFRRNVLINEWKWFVADILVASIYVITVAGYVYQHYTPGTVFYIGGLVTLVAYVNQFSSVFHDVAWQYNQIVRYNTDVCSVKEMQDAYYRYHPVVSDQGIDQNWNTIDIRNVNYSHHADQSMQDASIKKEFSGDTPTIHKPHSLHDISIQLKRGKRIAIIGVSGSGKSTFLSLLRGLYPAEEGAVVIQDIQNPDPGKMNGNKTEAHGKKMKGLEAIYELVTLFPQDPEIFENTIRYNITLGLDYTDDVIRKACETVAFQEVVDQLPNKLESSIKEKGVNLSGGQKQRLALARGILAAQTSDIILMDEPTSSIDPKTELIIYRRLFESFKDKVMISALHRLHLLEYFDYVYVMQDGKIVEEGSLISLKRNGIVFNELWKHLEV
ncbi:MAG: ABC transporter ATP-binding protein [Saprospiraceae bacterium]